MVSYSKEVQDALIDIYFEEFSKNINTPQYFKISRILQELDKPYKQRVKGRFPAWKNLLEKQIGCHIFAYMLDGDQVLVLEYVKEKSDKNQLYEKIMVAISEIIKENLKLIND